MNYPHVPPNSKKVFQGDIFSIWQWEQTLYDGTTSTFEMIQRPDTAYMVPIMSDNTILLVHDQQPHREAVITVPRGRVEKGEDPQDAAIRECEEETGYKVGTSTHWFSYAPYGKAMWQVHFYIGRDLTQVGKPQQAAGEKIKLLPVSFEEFIEKGNQGELQDPKLQIMILQAKLDPALMQKLKRLFYE